jgi:hypothetical protein
MKGSTQAATLQHRLKELLQGLDPQARRVALRVCRAYQDPHDTLADDEIRAAFDFQTRVARRAVRALKKLEKGLAKLEADVKGTLKGDTGSWYDVLREAHIPDGSPALLPTYEVEPTSKDYLRIKNIPDPAEPFERFLHMQHEGRRLAKKEADFVQSWIQTRARPKKRKITLFSFSGALQYTLQSLFKRQAPGRRLQGNEIETQITRILNVLDDGGPNIDPVRKDCAAIRVAIKRLPDRRKIWCDKFLAHQLNSSRP